MNDEQIREVLGRIDRMHPVGKDDKTICGLLDEAIDEWIPGSNAIKIFYYLAEHQAAMEEIGQIVKDRLQINDDYGVQIVLKMILDIAGRFVNQAGRG